MLELTSSSPSSPSPRDDMARTLVVVLPTQCDGDYSLHQHPRLLRRCGVVTRAILTRSDLAIDGASSHPPGSVFSVPCCVVLCSVVPSTMHCCAQVCCASHASGSTIKHTLTKSPFFSSFWVCKHSMFLRNQKTPTTNGEPLRALRAPSTASLHGGSTPPLLYLFAARGTVAALPGLQYLGTCIPQACLPPSLPATIAAPLLTCRSYQVPPPVLSF